MVDNPRRHQPNLKVPNPKAAPGNPADAQMEQAGQEPLQLTVKPDLEYHYRDLFNIFIGREEVILEFGNRHRSVAGQGTVMDRIVLSVPNAFRLQQGLGQGLQNVREQIQKQQEQGGEA